jgi:acetyl-CoA carboxylase biotin carboxyl carrier protein
MAKTSIDSEAVRSLAVLLDETNLTEIEYEAGGLYIRVARTPASPVSPLPAGAATNPATVATPPDEPAELPGTVKSPTVGVAYLSPEPGVPPFVAVGDTVAECQTLLLIEAM